MQAAPDAIQKVPGDEASIGVTAIYGEAELEGTLKKIATLFDPVVADAQEIAE